jgi:hypothetical protein
MPADWVPYIHYVCEVDQPLSISHRPFQCFASAWHAKSLEQRDATQHQSSNRWVECNESVKAVASCARKIYDIGGVVFDEGGRRGGGDLRLRWLKFLASFFFHFLQAIIYVCNSRCLDLKKKNEDRCPSSYPLSSRQSTSKPGADGCPRSPHPLFDYLEQGV